MQKEVLVAQSMVMLVLVGMVVWQHYRRTLKKGGKRGERSRNARGHCMLGSPTIVRIAG